MTKLTAHLQRAVRGEGGVVLVEGPAGIGKSSLLDACASPAAALGISVLRTRGDEVAIESSFAGVRELLWPQVQAVGIAAFDGAAALAEAVFTAETGGDADRERVGAVMHGLYWLVADLADRAPLMLAVDDAQWLDAASLRFLMYLAGRVDSLPVLLVVAVRQGESPQAVAALPGLATTVLHPEPLSAAGAAVLVRRRLGAGADDELCRSCHEATRGNPFYLHELVKALRDEDGRPSVESSRHFRSLGVDTVGRSVLVRLARLGHECELLAQAVSVLGSGTPLRRAAALIELTRGEAEAAADRLRSADVLAADRELSFVHPIVHEAIAAELAPSRRAALHAKAAGLLAAEAASPSRVAAHLVFAEPFGEAWVVETLRTAARQVLAQGAPEAGVSYLRRALAEPPAAKIRHEVLLELGRAETLLPIPHDFVALREALELAADPGQRIEIALELAVSLGNVEHHDAARVLLEEILEHSEDLDAALVERLDAHLLGHGSADLTATKRVLARSGRHFARAKREEVRDSTMLAALAHTGALTGLPATDVLRYARLALGDESLLGLWPPYAGAANALSLADALEEAVIAHEKGIAEAQRRGSAPMFMTMSAFRAGTALRAGELSAGEGHARRAFELGCELGAGHFAAHVLIPVLLEQDRAGAAWEVIEVVPLTERDLRLWQGVAVLAHRGRTRIAFGELEAGASDLLEADTRMTASECHLSVLLDWVPSACGALSRLGRRDEARDLAGRELAEATRFGARRRRGIALSVAGSLDRGPAGLARLHEAVRMLESSSARLELARALVNLGVGLRERDQPEPARGPLGRGLDLAHSCGAVALAGRARGELIATGARPRRAALSGAEALTPAELRTARMAADGLTNRQIAQALFVSSKTVEAHLSHAYGKLGIGTRSALSGALTAVRTGSGSPA